MKIAVDRSFRWCVQPNFNNIVVNIVDDTVHAWTLFINFVKRDDLIQNMSKFLHNLENYLPLKWTWYSAWKCSCEQGKVPVPSSHTATRLKRFVAVRRHVVEI